MNPHDRLRIVLAEVRLEWRAFAYVMQVHENYYIKRAGVAGIRARGTGWNSKNPAQPTARWRFQIERVRCNSKNRSAPQEAVEVVY